MAFEKNVFNKTSRTDSKCPPLPRPELGCTLSSSPSGHICPCWPHTPTDHSLQRFFFFPSCSPVPVGKLHSPPLSNSPPPGHLVLSQGKKPTGMWVSPSLELIQGMAHGGREWKFYFALGLLTPKKEAAARNRGWREGHRVAYVVSLVLVFQRIPWKGKKEIGGEVQSWRQRGGARQRGQN